ncbi:MAG: VCBS repeat-containing protein [Verrucomicrobiae bacterium]|nr:VCBS repeat-containing protein [Verrucomicrobiae bacterium]
MNSSETQSVRLRRLAGLDGFGKPTVVRGGIIERLGTKLAGNLPNFGGVFPAVRRAAELAFEHGSGNLTLDRHGRVGQLTQHFSSLIRQVSTIRQRPLRASFKLAWVLVVLIGGLSISPPTIQASQNAVSASKISLPTGPGSIEGLGESFEPQLNTGTYSMGLPLKLPPVRGAVQPEVRLAYNSGSGNGPLGLGWRLDVPALQRQTDKGLPQYTTNDTFVTFAGEELVALADGTFRAENEAAFTRWENLGPNGWRATRRDGTILRYGQTAQARQDHPELGTFKWMLESAQDLNGNQVAYSYVKDAGDIYLDAVEFGHHVTLPSSFYRLSFNYETNRPDCLADYRGRFRAETRWRLASAALEFEGRRIRFWRFEYHTNSPLSLLARFIQFGDERSATNGSAQLNTDYLPPVSFDYSLPPLGANRQWTDVGPFQNIRFAIREADLVDVNRDGLPDVLLYEDGRYHSYLNRGPALPFGPVQEFTSSVFYPALNLPTTKLADLRGDGSVKVLVEEDSYYYYRAFTGPTTLGVDVDYLVPGTFPISDPEVQLVDIDNDRALDFVATDQGDSTFAMVLSRAGAGSATVTKSPPTPLALNVSFASGWQFADLNGDRMPDLALIGTVEEGGTFFYPGKGFGEFDAVQAMGNGPNGPTESDRADGGLTLVDIDGDGLADLVSVRSGVVKIWRNQSGKEWAAPVIITDAAVPDWNGGVTTVRFADMNGNGSTDIVWNDPDQGIFLRYLDLNPGTKPNVMTRMANGMGRLLDIEYRTSTDYMLDAAGTSNAWTLIPPFPIPVVSAFTERDGLGSTYRTEITYRNGYYDALEREFRGFETAIRTDVGNDSQSAPSLLTEYRFDTGALIESLKGKPLQVERRNVDGEMFDRVSTVWTNRELPLTLAANETRTVNFAFQTRESTEVIERGLGTPVTLRREFEWDNYGNTIRLADFGRVEGANLSAWDDERITTNQFTAAFPDGLTKWILGLPVSETVTDENGNIITRTESFYDDETFSGNNPGAVTRGNLTLQRRLVNPATNQKSNVSRNRYDGYGNVTEIYDPLATPSSFAAGHARQIAYDSSLRTYPVTETIHIGGATPPLIVTAGYDLGLGVMTSSTDFNTNTSLYGYDTFGRITTITKPGDTTNAPTELYSYQLGLPLDTNRLINFIAASKREVAGGGTLDSRLFFDGLGRKVMVRAEGELPGQTVVTDTVVYNDRRAVWKKYLPYFETNSLAWNDPTYLSGFVENHYDALGRVTRAWQPEVEGERVFAETTYEPLARLVRDEEQTRTNSIHYGSAMRHIEDGLRNKDGAGRLRQVQEIVKLTGSDDPVGPPQTWTTAYEYDLLDQLTRITDSQNNVKVMAYDALARLTFMDDPDRGEMHYAYDDASNLQQTTDNKGQVIQYTYDGANRIKTEDYLGAAGKSPDVEYFYDAALPGFPGANVRGQLAAVRDLSGEEHFTYDARARIVAQTKRIPDPIFLSLSAGGEGQGEVVLVNYTTRYTYDSMDRVVSLNYPDGDAVTNLYNPRGLLARITGGPSGSIISNLSYRASAQLGNIRYGNEVLTSYDYDPRLRLSTLLTKRLPSPGGEGQGEGELIHFTYDFDAVSNIKAIHDHRPFSVVPANDPRRNTQLFQYDSLYRLTRAEYPAILEGSPGWIDYRYDRIGNMTSQLSNIPHVEDGKSVTDLGAMTSGGTAGSSGRLGKGSQPGPHALTRISLSAGGEGQGEVVRNYPYDANGNMTNIDGLTNTWDFKHRLIVVENGKMRAEYAYDYTDRRIMKRVWKKNSLSAPGGEGRGEVESVQYINKFFEIREHDSPVKYVWNGDTRVARVTGTLTPSAERQQFLRLHPGWNLASINVGNAQAQLDLANQPLLQTAVFWTNNSPGGEFLPITAATPLPAGTVAWLRVTGECVLTLTGTPPGPPPTELDSAGQFLANITGEGWDTTAAFPLDSSLHRFDAQAKDWQERSPAEQVSVSEVSPHIPTGESLFIKPAETSTINASSPSLSIRYYHQDHLRSSSVIADMESNLAEEATLYPFGDSRTRHVMIGAGSPHLFIQGEFDQNSGMTFLGHRYLLSVIGRMASVDPLKRGVEARMAQHPQSYLPYGYARNNPLNFFDPNGLFEVEESNANAVFSSSPDELALFISVPQPPKVTDGLQQQTRYAEQMLRRRFTDLGLIHGIGERAGKSDHPQGLALDIMLPKQSARGDEIVTWLTKHGDELGVKYVIWNDQIWSRKAIGERFQYSGEGNYCHSSICPKIGPQLAPTDLESVKSRASNDTVQHRDHVHVSFFSSEKLVQQPALQQNAIVAP